MFGSIISRFDINYSLEKFDSIDFETFIALIKKLLFLSNFRNKYNFNYKILCEVSPTFLDNRNQLNILLFGNNVIANEWQR